VARLVRIEAGRETSDSFPLSSVETQFGRMQGHYTFPRDKMMSRLHARILQRGADFLLEDASSRNGTFVNIRGKTPLIEGSAVLVGSQLLRVQA
jgi:pSer/pThr/pTyr-binding forkhead associated (FHA) protein